MTEPAPATPQRKVFGKERGVRGLFATDEQIMEELDVPKNVMWPVLSSLDKNKAIGFPPKHALFGGRRYWPAVKDWFDRHYGLPDQRSDHVREAKRIRESTKEAMRLTSRQRELRDMYGIEPTNKPKK